MELDSFLEQARMDAMQMRHESEVVVQMLDRETDWFGYRMRGYEFPVAPSTSSLEAPADQPA
jgi:hypothetical protein